MYFVLCSVPFMSRSVPFMRCSVSFRVSRVYILLITLTVMQACVQKISLLLKNFARSVTELVDSVDEAHQIFPASAHMDKVQGILVQILSNCSKLGTFKDIASPSQGQPDNADGGPQDDGLFVSDPLFWDACVELAKTYERTGRNAHPRTLTPPTFDLGFSFGPSQSRETANPKQSGSPQPSVCTKSELESGPHTPIERIPQLELESSGEGEHFFKSSCRGRRSQQLMSDLLSL